MTVPFRLARRAAAAALALCASLAMGANAAQPLPARPGGDSPAPASDGAAPADVAAAHRAAMGLGGAAPFDVTSDRLWYDGRAGDWIFDGHVLVERQGGVLHASRARFNNAAQALFLDGPVLAVQGTEVAISQGARIDLGTRATDLDSAILYVKQFWSPQLRALSDPAGARGLGHNAATLHAARAIKLDNGDTVLGDATVTPCDCAGRPDYEIDSPEVTVVGDRAWLARPRVLFMGVGVPFLPMALPLDSRESGLLAPQLGYSSSTGFRVAQPIYFTLGPSWDMTLTPGVFTGSFGDSHGSDLASRDVRGPRLGVELRGAPVAGSSGEIGLDLFQDFAAKNTLAQTAGNFPGEALSGSGRGLDGLRGTLRFAERTDFGAFHFVALGKLASDAMVIADTDPGSQMERYLDSLRTDVGLFGQLGTLALGFDATYLQDLRVANYGQPDRRLFGAEARPTPTRLPSPFLQLLPTMLGPFTFSAEASAASVATFATSAQEKATGFGPTDLGAGSAPSVPGTDLSRPTTLRLDLSPRLSLALPADSPVRGKLFVGARGDAWIFDGHPDRDAQRLQPLAGAEASLVLEKRFGDLLHTLEPQIFARAIAPALLHGTPLGDPADTGGLFYAANPLASEQNVPPGTARPFAPFDPSLLGLQPVAPGVLTNPLGATALGVPALRRALDEIDGSAPSTGEVETALALRQSLWGKPSGHGPPSRIASLTLEQDFVLWDHAGPARLADSSGTFSLALPYLTVNGELRWDWHLMLFSFAQATAAVHDARGDEIHTTETVLRGAAGDRIRAGIDEIFAATLLAAEPGDANGTVSGGVAWALPIAVKGARVGYDLSWHPGTLVAGTPDTVHTFSFTWTPPCGCAGLMLGVDLPFRDGSLLNQPSVRFSFQLQQFGR